MNLVTKSDVLAMDKLFATLDTTTRKIELQSGREYLFTDTVGFIQKLPHNLIKAFRATLEETKYADVLVHVVDSSNSAREEQMNIVYKTLKDLDCLNKPIITAYNKVDKEDIIRPLPKDDFSMYTLEISAKKGNGVESLLNTIEDVVKSFKKSINILIPYEKSNYVGMIHGRCEIVQNENRDEGMFFEIYADEEMENRLKEFII